MVKLFEQTDAFDEYKSFVIGLLTPLAERIGVMKRDIDGISINVFYEK